MSTAGWYLRDTRRRSSCSKERRSGDWYGELAASLTVNSSDTARGGRRGGRGTSARAKVPSATRRRVMAAAPVLVRNLPCRPHAGSLPSWCRPRPGPHPNRRPTSEGRQRQDPKLEVRAGWAQDRSSRVQKLSSKSGEQSHVVGGHEHACARAPCTMTHLWHVVLQAGRVHEGGGRCDALVLQHVLPACKGAEHFQFTGCLCMQLLPWHRARVEPPALTCGGSCVG